ncbi:type I-E CRISPR-associated endoribonuclease Cas2e [Caballeronia sp. LZ019]|uniref:type I-E CRISPR-associated endoribonuclease Cas2e n=1 Tax=Caballeronia sp. LZ019 TaxID=3038555 RepID=UPI002855B240|nr:type I-E CRISPR-associated endoribonuclease Cas2e [Caballeronia sp. LZ019]MDR5807517.1 type I-E CRISPR-associated endoribonuclease Cas2e [Caballeronia sp. LZ019]
MALVVVVTRDVADRFRGYLASVMLEVSTGVYVAPRMNKGVRERTWSVLAEWHRCEPRGSVAMVWRELDAVGGIGIAQLGAPVRELVDVDGMYLVRRAVGQA